MNLSNLVHTGRQHFEQQSQYSPAQQSSTMNSAASFSHYVPQPHSHQTSYQYSSIPQPPPSPPVDETVKCSLPSISSLLGISGGQNTQEPQQSQTSLSNHSGSGKQQYVDSPRMSSRAPLPPTPPMQVEAGYDGRHSPSATSTSAYSVASAPNYSFHSVGSSSFNNLEPHTQRQTVSTAPRRVSMPNEASRYAQSPYAGSSHYSPGSQSINSYYSSPVHPTPPQSQVSQGMYYQRPLPQQFTPQMMPVSVSLTPSSGANMWQHQHHHYISPSSAAAFPQSQDRYICQTCNKAFSRPSSLRIHSHSHTGEKPFRCSHKGCEKAFSVRSNMKRHERGCHEGLPM